MKSGILIPGILPDKRDKDTGCMIFLCKAVPGLSGLQKLLRVTITDRDYQYASFRKLF